MGHHRGLGTLQVKRKTLQLDHISDEGKPAGLFFIPSGQSNERGSEEEVMEERLVLSGLTLAIMIRAINWALVRGY